MYKVLLCWRYLRTRLIALPSVISVMLGVATIIVVNSVMGGFAREMRARIRGAYADVMVSDKGRDGLADYEEIIRRIKADLGPRVVALSPVVTAYGLLSYDLPGLGHERSEVQDVILIGVDPAARAEIGQLGQWIQKGRQAIVKAFEESQAAEGPGPRALLYYFLGGPALERSIDDLRQRLARQEPPSFAVSPAVATLREHYYQLPWVRQRYKHKFHDDRLDVYEGALVGVQLIGGRYNGRDYFYIGPGLDVKITTFVNDVWGAEGSPISVRPMTIADVFKSGMSEYDSKFVYVPLKVLQEMRDMEGRADSIHIKLDDYAHAPEAVERITRLLADLYQGDVARMPRVETWESKNTPILSAVAIETTILNILLFFIIAVAGFGILAIFAMIVVEKTRDIGILKALGGSNRGVMSIFLGYGLLLGLLGSGLGLLLAVLFVEHIDPLEQFLTRLTGHEVFDRNIYYFDTIPRDADPWMMAWVVLGAILIAVLASVYPAWRASRLNPVETLRHE